MSLLWVAWWLPNHVSQANRASLRPQTGKLTRCCWCVNQITTASLGVHMSLRDCTRPVLRQMWVWRPAVSEVTLHLGGSLVLYFQVMLSSATVNPMQQVSNRLHFYSPVLLMFHFKDLRYHSPRFFTNLSLAFKGRTLGVIFKNRAHSYLVEGTYETVTLLFLSG